MESVDLENKNSSQKVDRVVLDPSSIVVIQKLSEQINSEIGDLVQLSQKDIANFLIQKRSSALTEAEINQIKNEHFDIVRALKRATQEAIKAKQDGNEIKINELLKIIQTPSVMQNSGVKRPRKSKIKSDSAPSLSEKISTALDDKKTTQEADTDIISNSPASRKNEENVDFNTKKSP